MIDFDLTTKLNIILRKVIGTNVNMDLCFVFRGRTLRFTFPIDTQADSEPFKEKIF